MIQQKGLFGKKVTGRTVPYNMFCIVGIVVLIVNILLSALWPFRDPEMLLVFTIGIVLLLSGMLLYRYYSTFIAILLVIIVYNGLIFWVSLHMGRSSGAMLYYFPFMVGFLYLFLYDSNLAKSIVQVVLTIVFVAVSFFYTEFRTSRFFVPDPALELIYMLNLLFSIAATVIILISLYKQFIRLHTAVLVDKEKEHRELLRALDMEREKQGYALLLSLRDDISQTLATSRMYLQLSPPDAELNQMADEQIKVALAGLNEISLELSPSMLIDLGFKEGLQTYATMLSDKYGIPVGIGLAPGSRDVPEMERLSLYRILQQCIKILTGKRDVHFLHITLNCQHTVSLVFQHDSPAEDYAIRFRDGSNNDLSKRLHYYSAGIKEEKGRVELELALAGTG